MKNIQITNELVNSLINHVLNEGGCLEHNQYIVKFHTGLTPKVKSNKKMVEFLKTLLVD